MVDKEEITDLLSAFNMYGALSQSASARLIRYLCNEADSLESERDSLQVQLDAANTKINRLQIVRRSYKESAEHFELEAHAANKQLDEAKHELRMMKDAAASYDSKFDELQSQLDEVRAQRRELEVALEPFATSGPAEWVERDNYGLMTDRIKDWLGATDFRRARETYFAHLRQQAKEPEQNRDLFPMELAPKDGTPIVALCKHDADPYYLKNTNMLTPYGAHCEGMSHVIDGYHVVVWGGEYTETSEYGPTTTIPDWWFQNGSDFEIAANPIGWLPLPPLSEPGKENE